MHETSKAVADLRQREISERHGRERPVVAPAGLQLYVGDDGDDLALGAGDPDASADGIFTAQIGSRESFVDDGDWCGG